MEKPNIGITNYMEKLQIPATIESLRTLADGTIRLSIGTQELNPEDSTVLMRLVRKLGWFVFKENRIDDDEIPTENVPEFKTDGKTPSERLHAVLYVLWNTCTKKEKPFDIFYAEYIEKVIEGIKSKLPPKYE